MKKSVLFPTVGIFLASFLLASCDNHSNTDMNAAQCGNHILEPGEECDGAPPGWMTCSDYGYMSGYGQLKCTDSCSLDFSECVQPGCGNGILEDDEECEPGPPPHLRDETCESQGYYYGGELGCTDECTFDYSTCEQGHCGDGTVQEEHELCDASGVMVMGVMHGQCMECTSKWLADQYAPLEPHGTPHDYIQGSFTTLTTDDNGNIYTMFTPQTYGPGTTLRIYDSDGSADTRNLQDLFQYISPPTGNFFLDVASMKAFPDGTVYGAGTVLDVDSNNYYGTKAVIFWRSPASGDSKSFVMETTDLINSLVGVAGTSDPNILINIKDELQNDPNVSPYLSNDSLMYTYYLSRNRAVAIVRLNVSSNPSLHYSYVLALFLEGLDSTSMQEGVTVNGYVLGKILLDYNTNSSLTSAAVTRAGDELYVYTMVHHSDSNPEAMLRVAHFQWAQGSEPSNGPVAQTQWVEANPTEFTSYDAVLHTRKNGELHLMIMDYVLQPSDAIDVFLIDYLVSNTKITLKNVRRLYSTQDRLMGGRMKNNGDGNAVLWTYLKFLPNEPDITFAQTTPVLCTINLEKAKISDCISLEQETLVINDAVHSMSPATKTSTWVVVGETGPYATPVEPIPEDEQDATDYVTMRDAFLNMMGFIYTDTRYADLSHGDATDMTQ